MRLTHPGGASPRAGQGKVRRGDLAPARKVTSRRHPVDFVWISSDTGLLPAAAAELPAAQPNSELPAAAAAV